MVVQQQPPVAAPGQTVVVTNPVPQPTVVQPVGSTVVVQERVVVNATRVSIYFNGFVSERN